MPSRSSAPKPPPEAYTPTKPVEVSDDRASTSPSTSALAATLALAAALPAAPTLAPGVARHCPSVPAHVRSTMELPVAFNGAPRGECPKVRSGDGALAIYGVMDLLIKLSE